MDDNGAIGCRFYDNCEQPSLYIMSGWQVWTDLVREEDGVWRWQGGQQMHYLPPWMAVFDADSERRCARLGKYSADWLLFSTSCSTERGPYICIPGKAQSLYFHIVGLLRGPIWVLRACGGVEQLFQYMVTEVTEPNRFKD